MVLQFVMEMKTDHDLSLLFSLAQKLSQNQKVFLGTFTFLGLCGVPVFFKNEKRGHDLFSQERPEAILESQEKALKEFDRQSREARKSSKI